MKYIHLPLLDNQSYKEDVWQLVCRYDQDFIPALSNRRSSAQQNLSEQTEVDTKPYSYFNNLLQQSIILACNEDNRVVGFMSYKPSYMSADLEDNQDTVYITTIIVDEAYRSKGITSTLYKEIEVIATQLNKPMMTRTWSTNRAHIHVLNKIGMLEIKRIPNARGKGIDTVYFRKALGG